ncbi:hypothetical protein [Brevundimonas sp.]|uniref:hypothetical protein n=1 Tax=Brevundimonas sp. TaxID=1871086 RepID=UPI003569DECE
MSGTTSTPPDAFLDDRAFDDLAAGKLSPAALDQLRAKVQAALNDPDDGVSHDALWDRLEQRMKRAVARAA